MDSLKFLPRNTLIEIDREIADFIVKNKTFDVEKIFAGLTQKHAGRFMELVVSAEKEVLDEELVSHISTLQNEAYDKIPKLNWSEEDPEIGDRYGHLTIPEAFKAREEDYKKTGE